ncbi:hypothetical protein [Glutamicibacter protophormiae]|uniref:hypothetical protein n=1 Tax=Glutamicibacter protophormiae TaxID=37930 RepID=UPI001956F8AE|nr:hypothetical protein [Glutamicibacter protophormiae]QRQ78614.1 hypothetical protein JQN66_17265 [Glutamicibacter protophormiae]
MHPDQLYDSYGNYIFGQMTEAPYLVFEFHEAQDHSLLVKTGDVAEKGTPLGKPRTYKPGKKPGPSTSTYFYRCLAVVNIYWGDIAPNCVGLARGLAKTYNATKRYNNGQYPEPEVIVLASKVMEYLVRLIALHLVDTKGNLLDSFRKEPGLLRISALHRHLAVSFDENGTVVPYVVSSVNEQEPEG